MNLLDYELLELELELELELLELLLSAEAAPAGRNIVQNLNTDFPSALALVPSLTQPTTTWPP